MSIIRETKWALLELFPEQKATEADAENAAWKKVIADASEPRLKPKLKAKAEAKAKAKRQGRRRSSASTPSKAKAADDCQLEQAADSRRAERCCPENWMPALPRSGKRRSTRFH